MSKAAKQRRRAARDGKLKVLGPGVAIKHVMRGGQLVPVAVLHGGYRESADLPMLEEAARRIFDDWPEEIEDVEIVVLDREKTS